MTPGTKWDRGVWRCSLVIAVTIQCLITSSMAQNTNVEVEGRAMSWDDALPVLTRKLHLIGKSDISDREGMKALSSLIDYGDQLLGTDALKKIITLLDEHGAFPVMDKVLSLTEDEQKQFRLQPLSAETQKEVQAFVIKALALAAVIVSGDREGVAVFRRYEESSCLPERKIAAGALDAANFSLDRRRGALHPKSKRPRGGKYTAPRESGSASTNNVSTNAL